MKWRLFICSDCDLDDGVVVMRVPDDASHERSCAIEHCPGCGSYLSMIGTSDVDVEGHALVHVRLRERAS